MNSVAKGNTGHGIYTASTASGLKIINCKVKDNSKRGISLIDSGGGNLVKSCEVGNNSWNDIAPASGDIYYDLKTDLFMDCLAADLDHVHVLVDYDALEHTDVISPDVPRNVSVSLYNNTAGSIATAECTCTVTGRDAKGFGATETITIPANAALGAGAYQTAYGSKAFSKISKIQFSDVAQPAGTQMCVGISDKLGLSNVIYGTGDVYKVKKNNADVAVGTVDVTNGTVDCATIISGDDFTIYYRSNLNTIG
jgi:parallel beta-helix repeat protein